MINFMFDTFGQKLYFSNDTNACSAETLIYRFVKIQKDNLYFSNDKKTWVKVSNWRRKKLKKVRRHKRNKL